MSDGNGTKPKREEKEPGPGTWGIERCAGCGVLLYTTPATLIYVARTECRGDVRVHHKGRVAYYCDSCLKERHSDVRSVIDQIRGPQ